MRPRLIVTILLLQALGFQPAARAEPAEAARTEEPESRWTLGLRGFGGGVLSKEEQRAGGGGTALVAYGIVPERWEIEAGISLIAARDVGLLGVFEVAGKCLFEPRGKLAPHILLGPVFSLDFGDELKPSGGLLLGGGATYWFHPRVGAVLDGTYRLLIGAEVEHVLALALGLGFRI